MNKKITNHLDFSSNKVPERVTCDVLIIGTGAGGGIAADILSQTGAEVILIEEGPLKYSSDFNMRERDAYAELYQEAATRKTISKEISILQGRSVGGSTTVNWTTSLRIPDLTLDYWTSKCNLNEIGEQKLEPWYEYIEEKLGVEEWKLPLNENNNLLKEGAQKLGWTTKVLPRNVKGCANLGYCGLGCPIDAKQSMLVTTIPAATQRGARIFSRARAETLIIKNNSVVGATLSPMNKYGQQSGSKNCTIIAKHVVLAAGAIGTPGILLRSNIPDPFKRVGKRTMLHPTALSIAEMNNPVNAFYGAPQSICSDQFLWRDGASGDLGFKLEASPIHPVLASTIYPYHGKSHAEFMQKIPKLQSTLALMRDGFHPESIGGSVKLDKYNNPALDYKINTFLMKGVQFSMLKMAELQFSSGATSIFPVHGHSKSALSWNEAKEMINNLSIEASKFQLFSAHVMGGCCMSENEKYGVVDHLGRSHTLKNLTIIDGSVFPTSLGVNPQLGIFALSARNATNLAKDL